MDSLIIPFAIVLLIALFFLVVLFLSRSKYFTPIYATISAVCWFALSGLNLATFPAEAAVLSFLYFAIGVVVLLMGLVLSLSMMKADNEAKELQL